MNGERFSEWRSRMLASRAAGYVWSWKDADELNRMREAVCETDADSEPEEILIDCESVSEELGYAYEAMDRILYASLCFTQSVRLMASLFLRFGNGSAQMAPILFKAVQMRNYYRDDPCPDLAGWAKTVLGENADEVMEIALSESRVLNHDPVETSPDYLRVIDGIEAEMDSDPQLRRATAAEKWAIKKRILLEKGIRWRSPADCNPTIRFN